MAVKYQIFPKGLPNYGYLYVDNQKNLRSGHLSHALVEYKKDCIMSFYSNCSGTRNKNSPGHNGFGWLEYRRSMDGGVSWDAPKVFPYSWDSFINQPFTISCEAAVSTKENEIVAFCTRNLNPEGWEPYLSPTVVISLDGGETWGEPVGLTDKEGRVWDAKVIDGAIYVLFQAAPDGIAKSSDEKYYIYRSTDGGHTYAEHSYLPGDLTGRLYGKIVVREDGSWICYTYNIKDEHRPDYFISYDSGLSWTECGQCYCAKRIRNPQVARVKGGYIMHGRAGCGRAADPQNELPPHFVLYTSEDGIHWDEGVYLCAHESFSAYYSNNLVLTRKDGSQHVLIQSSTPYDKGRVNVCHWFLEIE